MVANGKENDIKMANRAEALIFQGNQQQNYDFWY